MAFASSQSSDTIPDQDRSASVDALRGWVITLMIFVNDVSGVDRAPSWLKHVKADFDGMTLPDLVFPSFLFIAGVSIPLALGKALSQGAQRMALCWKILNRTFALLVMGVFMVNMDSHNPWIKGLWGLLAYAAMFLAFAVVPRTSGAAQSVFRYGRWFGAVALLVLGLVYKNGEGRHLMFGPLFDASDTVWFRHEWWGILGLIGWAYLVAALAFLVLGRRREWLVGATGLLMLLFIAGKSGYAARYASREWLSGVQGLLSHVQSFLGWIDSHVSFETGFGSLASITLAGCCLGSILMPGSEIKKPSERLRWCSVFVAGLLLAACFLDGAYGINKIQATPTWCFLCAAITAGIWILLYWIMDIRNITEWSRVIRPAGANPLLAYVLHPVLYLVAGMLSVNLGFYRSSELPVAVGILGSMLMAILVVQLTGLIVRAGYRMKA